MNYRIKYWIEVNEFFGEWHRTGLMTKQNAIILAKSLRELYSKVEIYFDDDGV